MELLKKHYEKVLLGAVLLGLMVGAALLPLMISRERQGLEDKSHSILDRKIEPLPPVDLSGPSNLLQRAASPIQLNLTVTNKLFNPMVWQRFPDGRPPLKMPSGGPTALCQVTHIGQLFTIVTLDNVQTNDSGARYVIGVEREAAPVAVQRRKKQYYTSKDSKTDAFIIRDVRGQPDNPSELGLEMSDTGEQIVISKDHPFRRVDGFTADLKYPPENKTWANQRVNSVISFAGETYIVVAISKDEVVLSAQSNKKKTPISFNPAPDSQ